MNTIQLVWKTVKGKVKVEGSQRMFIIGATVSTAYSTSKTGSGGVFSIKTPCGLTQIEVSHPHFYPYSTMIALDPWTGEIINLEDIQLRYRGKPRRYT